jgi:hypothetical protein
MNASSQEYPNCFRLISAPANARAKPMAIAQFGAWRHFDKSSGWTGD